MLVRENGVYRRFKLFYAATSATVQPTQHEHTVRYYGFNEFDEFDYSSLEQSARLGVSGKFGQSGNVSRSSSVGLNSSRQGRARDAHTIPKTYSKSEAFILFM